MSSKRNKDVKIMQKNTINSIFSDEVESDPDSHRVPNWTLVYFNFDKNSTIQ